MSPEETLRTPVRYLRHGFVTTLPAAVSAGVYGIILGALAAERSISLGVLWLQNTVLFAGASQFVMVGSWSAPLPVAPIVLSVLAINLRYVLITASLRPIFHDAPKWQRFAFLHLVADENWAVAMAEYRRRGTTPWFLFGGGLCMYSFWMLGTTLGQQLGSLIRDPKVYAMDFAFAAVFVALAVSFWRGRNDLLPWLSAALAAAASSFLIDGNWYVIIGGIVGASVAAALPGRGGEGA
ncbi:MAG: branched-chain amino acid ABC transporter permease [Spirochaetes bacterium]|jgi:4-azaleucine resistance transporter AzlC|nr:branched-chain amino acid ABC transporter permease [Spirochaetota bacterium]